MCFYTSVTRAATAVILLLPGLLSDITFPDQGIAISSLKCDLPSGKYRRKLLTFLSFIYIPCIIIRSKIIILHDEARFYLIHVLFTSLSFSFSFFKHLRTMHFKTRHQKTHLNTKDPFIEYKTKQRFRCHFSFFKERFLFGQLR